jgi:hypothetical protein
MESFRALLPARKGDARRLPDGQNWIVSLVRPEPDNALEARPEPDSALEARPEEHGQAKTAERHVVIGGAAE